MIRHAAFAAIALFCALATSPPARADRLDVPIDSVAGILAGAPAPTAARLLLAEVIGPSASARLFTFALGLAIAGAGVVLVGHLVRLWRRAAPAPTLDEIGRQQLKRALRA